MYVFFKSVSWFTRFKCQVPKPKNERKKVFLIQGLHLQTFCDIPCRWVQWRHLAVRHETLLQISFSFICHDLPFCLYQKVSRSGDPLKFYSGDTRFSSCLFYISLTVNISNSEDLLWLFKLSLHLTDNVIYTTQSFV